jgi:hypothetical protein
MNKNDFEIPTFDYKTFKKDLQSGDINGLEYLEKTMIRELKDKCNDNYTGWKYQDYIVNLFYATIDLNRCVDIYETSKVKNNFNYDLYTETRDLLFEEIGFNLDDLWDME